MVEERIEEFLRTPVRLSFLFFFFFFFFFPWIPSAPQRLMSRSCRRQQHERRMTRRTEIEAVISSSSSWVSWASRFLILRSRFSFYIAVAGGPHQLSDILDAANLDFDHYPVRSALRPVLYRCAGNKDVTAYPVPLTNTFLRFMSGRKIIVPASSPVPVAVAVADAVDPPVHALPWLLARLAHTSYSTTPSHQSLIQPTLAVFCKPSQSSEYSTVQNRTHLVIWLVGPLFPFTSPVRRIDGSSRYSMGRLSISISSSGGRHV